MKDEEPQPDEDPPGPGRFAVAALRAVDAAIRALQKLRDRIAAPAEDEESGTSMLDGAATAEAEEPRPKSLLHRALIVLMCIVLGAAGGAWIAYRALSKRAVSQEKLIDFMRDDIEQSRKAEALSLKARDKCFDDIVAYRQQTREAKQEIADCQSQVESLSQQVAEPKRAERPASRPGPAPATPSPRAAPRSGTCVTGGNNAAGNLLDCIEKFNR